MRRERDGTRNIVRVAPDQDHGEGRNEACRPAPLTSFCRFAASCPKAGQTSFADWSNNTRRGNLGGQLDPLAGGRGFEPRLAESESAVLPLNYPPIRDGAAGCGAPAAYNSLTKRLQGWHRRRGCEPATGAITASSTLGSAGLSCFVRLRFTATCPSSPLVHQELRPVFEVHGVVMIPGAAPDEAVLLKNADDLEWNRVSIGQRPTGRGL